MTTIPANLDELVDDLERRGDQLCAEAIAAHDAGEPDTERRLIAEALASYDDADAARELHPTG